MENLQRLLLSELGIPAWQLVLFVGLISFFTFTHRVRIGLIAAYLLQIYWNFYVFRAYLFSVAGGDFLALAAYILFGIALAGLSLYTFFFFRESSHFPGLAGLEISRLRRTLLKRMESMESAVLGAAAEIAVLQAKLQGTMEDLGKREATFTEARHVEGKDQGREAEEKAVVLEALLKEQEESFGRRAASFKEVIESLHDRIHKLEQQLKERENLLETRAEEGKKEKAKGYSPSGGTGEPAHDLQDNIEAELERIKAGLREGEVPLRQER